MMSLGAEFRIFKRPRGTEDPTGWPLLRYQVECFPIVCRRMSQTGPIISPNRKELIHMSKYALIFLLNLIDANYLWFSLPILVRVEFHNGARPRWSNVRSFISIASSGIRVSFYYMRTFSIYWENNAKKSSQIKYIKLTTYVGPVELTQS